VAPLSINMAHMLSSLKIQVKLKPTMGTASRIAFRNGTRASFALQQLRDEVENPSESYAATVSIACGDPKLASDMKDCKCIVSVLLYHVLTMPQLQRQRLVN
jgi:hypothetical protein